MSTTLMYRFVVKRDTHANFTAANTLLMAGEFSLETDTKLMKMGDGVTTYNTLRFLDLSFKAVASGTNTLTASFPSPPILVDQMSVRLRAAGANTGAVTFNPNSLGAVPVTKQGGTALVAGDIVAAGHELTLVYNSSIPRWELLNPGASSGGSSDSRDSWLLG